jgi:hypothetical protein
MYQGFRNLYNEIKEGILIWRFFLNSSRLFKDFRKIEYAMPCNLSYARLFLKGFSYARQIDMQPICTSILAKFYSWKMWVLQTYLPYRNLALEIQEALGNNLG